MSAATILLCAAIFVSSFAIAALPVAADCQPVRMQTDKPYYNPGETVWITIWTSCPLYNAYIVIQNPDGTSIEMSVNNGYIPPLTTVTFNLVAADTGQPNSHGPTNFTLLANGQPFNGYYMASTQCFVGL